MEEETEQREAAIARLKRDLLALSRKTARGFRATNAEKQSARQLLFDLARYFDPTKVQPARPYYNKNSNSNGSSSSEEKEKLSLQGKWELVFTDAPDITSLEQNNLAQLGRIGQECEAPYIKNVIEWKPPSWARNLPLVGGGSNDRVLQKVVTQGTADPARPATVQLKVAGLQIEAAPVADPNRNDNTAGRGLIANLLQQRPVDLVNPNSALPFGTFEVLYLDDTMRATRTGQNFVAVNTRLTADEAWF